MLGGTDVLLRLQNAQHQFMTSSPPEPTVITIPPTAHIHLAWIVIVVVLFLGGWWGVSAWTKEHDARVIAEAAVKTNETQVATLQQAIVVNNQSIAALEAQVAARDVASAQVIQSLTRARAAAVTPTQQTSAISTDVKLPTPIVSIPGTADYRLPGVDVQPLFNEINTGQQCAVDIATDEDDLTDCKTESADKDKTIADQVAQLGLKDTEIKVLKRPKGFWKSLASDLKKVAIGLAVGIGITVAVIK